MTLYRYVICDVCGNRIDLGEGAGYFSVYFNKMPVTNSAEAERDREHGTLDLCQPCFDEGFPEKVRKPYTSYDAR